MEWYLNDCPHRSVVLMQSSVKLTGSLCHSCKFSAPMDGLDYLFTVHVQWWWLLHVAPDLTSRSDLASATRDPCQALPSAKTFARWSGLFEAFVVCEQHHQSAARPSGFRDTGAVTTLSVVARACLFHPTVKVAPLREAVAKVEKMNGDNYSSRGIYFTNASAVHFKC